MCRYYSILRPVGIGTYPKPTGNKVVAIENFDNRTYVDKIDREAWGYIEYEKPLDKADMDAYDLVEEADVVIKFETGKVVYSAEVAEKASTNREFRLFILEAIKRYLKCDWGDICDDDKEANKESLKNGSMLMGSYSYKDKAYNKESIIWIITEGDRSVTTILFPHEY